MARIFIGSRLMEMLAARTKNFHNNKYCIYYKEVTPVDEKTIYKQKIEARLALAHAQHKLNDLKTLAQNCPEDKVLEFSKGIEELEKNFIHAKSKLRELNEAGDEAWRNFKESAEQIWNALRVSVKNATARYKELH